MKPIECKVVAAALVEHDGGVVLLRRAGNFRDLDQGHGQWEPPGGTVDPGERIEDAVRREVREETGIDLPDGGTLAAVINYTLEGSEKTVHRFHVLYSFVLENAPRVQLGEEHDEALTVREPSDLDGLEIIGELRQFLAGWLRG